MTNDEKKREDSPKDRRPWYGRPMGKPPEEEKVTITEDDVGVIEVDAEGVVRVPGQDMPRLEPDPDEQAEAKEAAPRVRLVRVLEISGTAYQINAMLDKSAVGPSRVKEVGGVVVTETYRHQLKEGDYVVTTIKNRAKDG